MYIIVITRGEIDMRLRRLEDGGGGISPGIMGKEKRECGVKFVQQLINYRELKK